MKLFRFVAIVLMIFSLIGYVGYVHHQKNEAKKLVMLDKQANSLQAQLCLIRGLRCSYGCQQVKLVHCMDEARMAWNNLQSARTASNYVELMETIEVQLEGIDKSLANQNDIYANAAKYYKEMMTKIAHVEWTLEGLSSFEELAASRVKAKSWQVKEFDKSLSELSEIYTKQKVTECYGLIAEARGLLKHRPDCLIVDKETWSLAYYDIEQAWSTARQISDKADYLSWAFKISSPEEQAMDMIGHQKGYTMAAIDKLSCRVNTYALNELPPLVVQHLEGARYYLSLFRERRDARDYLGAEQALKVAEDKAYAGLKLLDKCEERRNPEPRTEVQVIERYYDNGSSSSNKVIHIPPGAGIFGGDAKMDDGWGW